MPWKSQGECDGEKPGRFVTQGLVIKLQGEEWWRWKLNSLEKNEKDTYILVFINTHIHVHAQSSLKHNDEGKFEKMNSVKDRKADLNVLLPLMACV